MKKHFKGTKNILWLAKPYFKYGKPLLFYGLFNSAVIWPLRDIMMVYTPQLIVNAVEASTGTDGAGGFAGVLLFMAALYAAMLALYALGDYYYEYLSKVTGERVKLRINRSVYDKAQSTDYACIDDPVFYDKYKWAQDNFAAKSGDAVEIANKLLRGVMCILTLSSVIATVSPLVLLVVTAYACVRLPLNARMNKLEIEREESVVPQNRRLDYVHRLFYMKDYAADLRATRLPDVFRAYYDKYANEKISKIERLSKSIFRLDVVLYFLYEVTQFFVMLLVVLSFYRGELGSAAMLITMFLAAENLTGDLWDITEVIKEYGRVSGYGARVREFFDLPSKIEAGNDNGGDALPAPTGAFTVELRDVGFRYTDDAPFVLRHFSLSLRAGERLAVVGENGAGKSTLVKLLMRFYDVTEGEILINGEDIRRYDVRGLRRSIAAAFQDTNIYATTFAENLALLAEPEDEGAFRAVSEELHLGRILEKNNADENGEMTREFSESGIAVSGGEAQRIALARTLTGAHGMYILDEPSSALDPIAEYELTKMMVSRFAGKTTLLIAHRLSSVREMDKIALVSDGRVAESGTHDELMAQNGRYAEMFRRQAEGYAD